MAFKIFDIFPLGAVCVALTPDEEMAALDNGPPPAPPSGTAAIPLSAFPLLGGGITSSYADYEIQQLMDADEDVLLILVRAFVEVMSKWVP